MKILGCSWKEAAACTCAVVGLMLAGSEGPDLGAQIAVNVFGLMLFVVPAALAIRAQNRGSQGDRR